MKEYMRPVNYSLPQMRVKVLFEKHTETDKAYLDPQDEIFLDIDRVSPSFQFKNITNPYVI